MKVSYEIGIDRGEPVAYLEMDGSLLVKGKDGHYVYLDTDGGCGSYLGSDLGHVVKAFYKGDTVTITF